MFTSNQKELDDKSVSVASIKTMEYSTLKVPYDSLNKKYKLGQKVIDREVTHLSQSLYMLRNNQSAHSVNQALDNVVEKLVDLKRKADEVYTEEQMLANVCKRRISHLKGAFDTDPVNVNSWKKKRFDRLLVDHLSRDGYYESASDLVDQSNLADLTNMKLFSLARAIEASLLAGDTSKCLAWCYDNKSKLRRLDSTLELQLRQQEFIELIKQEKRLEAINHARKYLGNNENSQRQDLEHMMCLLAIPLNTNKEPYKSLLSHNRWKDLCEKFRYENFKLHQLGNSSVFSIALQSGLSSLKTRQCCSRSRNQNPDCPLCSPTLNKLAEGLPYPHSSQSKLICAISGLPINENNCPLMLPNGHIYGEVGIRKIADKRTGTIKCPKTQTKFSLGDIHKVFVM